MAYNRANQILQANSPEKNLNQKAWYRGLKVVYFTTLGAILLVGGAILSMDKPSIDMYQSSIHCLNSGKYYSMWKFTSSYTPGDTELTDYDNRLAMATCEASSQLNPNPTVPPISGLEIDSGSKHAPKSSYEVNFAVNDPRTIYFGVIIGLIVALELVKRTVLYVALGLPVIQAKPAKV